MTSLIDTNVLVYAFDSRHPSKQRTAQNLILEEIEKGTGRLAHQCLLEFTAATTRSFRGAPPILTKSEAAHEAEEFLLRFPVFYPTETIFRMAVRGWRTYGFSWFDAHLWSHAEVHQVDILYSEDFQHNRNYGMVRAVNPFRS